MTTMMRICCGFLKMNASVRKMMNQCGSFCFLSLHLKFLLMQGGRYVQYCPDGAWNADSEYTDWHWSLGRVEGGSWELLSWGYA